MVTRQVTPPSPKISVIIPVYNVEPYLARCLDSVICNTYQNLEIICVNDGSTDGSLNILRDYEAHDNRFLIIDKENGGVSSARNAGLSVASSEYISFIDSDDWIHPQYFEILLRIQLNTRADIVIGQYQQTLDSIPSEYLPVDTSSIDAHPLSTDALLQMRFSRNYVWGRLYLASLLKNHRFIEGVVFEDTPFNLSLLCIHEDIKVILVSHVLYFYYNRSTSIVHTASRLDLLKICQFYLDSITQHSSDHAKRILMEESIKKLLTVRYEALTDSNIKAVRQCNELLRKSLTLLLRTKSVSLKKKLQYSILAAFPQIYRQFRIKDDPTLLDWEKRKKRVH